MILGGSPHLILITHADAARTISGCNRRALVGEEYALCTIGGWCPSQSAQGCLTVKLAVNAIPVASKNSGEGAEVLFAVSSDEAVRLTCRRLAYHLQKPRL